MIPANLASAEEATVWMRGFDEGIEARVRSMVVIDNPHPQGTLERRGWREGWRLADEMIAIGETT